jgi:hypothetical protein
MKILSIVLLGAGFLRSGAVSTMSRWSRICACCVADGIPRRSFAVSLIVGTILNLINQGDALFGAANLNLTKILLTYTVPYCVATYGAVSYRLNVAQAARDSHSAKEVG